jgi:hypothetical protein
MLGEIWLAAAVGEPIRERKCARNTAMALTPTLLSSNQTLHECALPIMGPSASSEADVSGEL